MSGDFLRSRSQIHVFISISIDSIVLNYFFLLPLRFLQCLSLAQIEIDHLFIAARVNSTDWLSGGLISFCFPVMQLRLNQVMCTDTLTRKQTHTNLYPFLCSRQSPGCYPSIKPVSARILRSVCLEAQTHLSAPAHSSCRSVANRTGCH